MRISRNHNPCLGRGRDEPDNSNRRRESYESDKNHQSYVDCWLRFEAVVGAVILLVAIGGTETGSESTSLVTMVRAAEGDNLPRTRGAQGVLGAPKERGYAECI